METTNSIRKGKGLKGGSNVRSNNGNTTNQWHRNCPMWHGVLAFIKCKHDKYATQKVFMYLRAHAWFLLHNNGKKLQMTLEDY